MEKRQFVLDYINLCQYEDSRSDQVYDFFNQLGGSGFELISYNTYQFNKRIMTAILGDSNIEVIDWWLYDSVTMSADGEPPHVVKIDDVEYNVDTPELLVDLCIDLKQINNIVEQL